MVTFVLVHGAWLWASAWNRVADLLIANGYRVVAPCLTGLGEKRDLLSDRITLHTHVADVVTRLDEDDLTKVVMVGHGYAGMIIAGVAELRPSRLSQLVYLDAYIPTHGRSAWDLIPATLQAAFLEDANGGWRLPANEKYYTAWGLLPGSARDLIRANASDFSLRCLRTPLQLQNNNATNLPRAFVRGTRNYPARRLFDLFAQRARGEGWPIHEVEAGHVMYVEKPAELAEVLSRIASELPQAEVPQERFSGRHPQ
jgi:pimeloyl-ACP methyl ester carboxylesterase